MSSAGSHVQKKKKPEMFEVFGLRSMAFFVRLGYAVVETDAPIVGPKGR